MATVRFEGLKVPGPERDFVGYGRHAPNVRWPSPSAWLSITRKALNTHILTATVETMD
jgi:hypothetical protein